MKSNSVASRRKVLLIAYSFPPRTAVGSVRAEGLAKYLPKYGWDVSVLTADHPGGPEPRYEVYEATHRHWLRRFESMGSMASANTTNGSGHSLKGFRSSLKASARLLVCYPDPQIGWYKAAVSTGRSVISRERIDVILSTSKPETAHLVASALKAYSSLPWVADLRDLWTQNHYHTGFLWSLRRILETRLEKRTLGSADAIVSVSEPLCSELSKLHPDKMTLAIPNGFDPETYETGPHSLTRELSITYTGSLYDGRRDPGPLFKVVYKLYSRGMIDPNTFRVRFFGSDVRLVKHIAALHGVERFVEAHPRIPRNEILLRQRESHVLLSINWNRSEEEGVYTGKLFEYLAAKRPILAIGGPGGVVKSLLESTGAGNYASSEREIQQILEVWVAEYLHSGMVQYRGNAAKIWEYSHDGMARSFANLLNAVSATGQRESSPHFA